MRLFPTPVLAFLLALLAGCMQYAPIDQGPQRSVALEPIINESDLPQIIAPLTKDLRRGLNHSPNWRLSQSGRAEVTLAIRILERKRLPIARDPDDTGRPISYSEDIRASIEWKSESVPPWGTDPVRIIHAHTLVYADPSLVTAESAAVSQISEQLSRNIMSALDWPAN